MGPMKRVLVVANKTLCEQHLLDALRARRQAGPCMFHLLVPASHPAGSWTDATAEREARARLEEILDTLAVGGIAAVGEIGDGSPFTAVEDLLLVRGERFDEIIVSTLPTAISRWQAQGVVRRLSRFGLPVTHVVAEPAEALL
jgi:hypothetical protein